ncbi:MAG: mechanosensitive ion channel family protein, partial [Deltaproteobacteria bacterium]|nr:mechanosensitive ion channel family protein [Deltaproteobacteria bacterium]
MRTLDHTVVSVPNAEFMNLPLDNFSKREKIRYHPKISLRYETTPNQIRYILAEI